MNQRRSPDEPSAARVLEDESADAARPPHSGIAPRDPDRESHAEGEEQESLYDRLLRSGALDEVMEVAAEEQRALTATDFQADAETRGPTSEVVPSSRDATEDDDDLGLDIDFSAADVDVSSSARDADATPVRLPRNDETPTLPSVMLGPDAAPRRDATERIVLRDAPEATRRPSLTAASARPGREEKSDDGAPLLALVALLCVTAGALVFWFVTRPEPSVPAAPPPATSRAAEATEQLEASQPSATSSPRQEPEPAPPVVAEEPEPEPQTAPPPPRAATPRRAPKRAAEPEAAAVPAPAPPAAEPSLPEQPSRDEVVRVMTGLLPTLTECAAGQHGDLRLRMTVLGSGRVTHAEVQGGGFEGTPAGSCMARAVREARFGEFASRFVRLTYPVRL